MRTVHEARKGRNLLRLVETAFGYTGIVAIGAINRIQRGRQGCRRCLGHVATPIS